MLQVLVKTSKSLENTLDIETKKKRKKVNNHSLSVHEIFGNPPKRIVRTGSGIILITLLFILFASAFIKYPEVLPAEILLTKNEPPVEIIVKSSGKIENIFVHDNQRVKKGQILAIIESSVNFDSLLTIKKILDTNCDYVNYNQSSYSYGELSEGVISFINSIEKHRFFYTNNNHESEITILKRKIANYYKFQKEQLSARKLIQRKISILRQDYLRNEALLEEGVISPRTLEEKELSLLSEEIYLEEIDQSLTSTKQNIIELEQRILELETLFNKNVFELENEIESNKKKLKSSIIDWERKYLLKSPIEGRISFIDIWNKNQYVEKGKKVFWIEPYDRNEIIGKMKLPSRNSGKVKLGQTVHVHLENFPSEEYGILKGEIINKSLIPENGFYHLDVTFPNGVKTTKNDILKINSQIKGTANIVTENNSIMSRIFYSFKRLVSREVK